MMLAHCKHKALVYAPAVVVLFSKTHRSPLHTFQPPRNAICRWHRSHLLPNLSIEGILVRIAVDFRCEGPYMRVSKTTRYIRDSLRRSAMGPNFHKSDPHGFSSVNRTLYSIANRMISAEKVANWTPKRSFAAALWTLRMEWRARLQIVHGVPKCRYQSKPEATKRRRKVWVETALPSAEVRTTTSWKDLQTEKPHHHLEKTKVEHASPPHPAPRSAQYDVCPGLMKHPQVQPCHESEGDQTIWMVCLPHWSQFEYVSIARLNRHPNTYAQARRHKWLSGPEEDRPFSKAKVTTRLSLKLKSNFPICLQCLAHLLSPIKQYSALFNIDMLFCPLPRSSLNQIPPCSVMPASANWGMRNGLNQGWRSRRGLSE